MNVSFDRIFQSEKMDVISRDEFVFLKMEKEETNTEATEALRLPNECEVKIRLREKTRPLPLKQETPTMKEGALLFLLYPNFECMTLVR